MNKSIKYQLLISDNYKTITLKEFPEVNIKYISSRNELCPSEYDKPDTKSMCFWEGDLEVKLNVNGTLITINDHDKRKGVVSTVVINNNKYHFQGVSAKVINKDKMRRI